MADTNPEIYGGIPDAQAAEQFASQGPAARVGQVVQAAEGQAKVPLDNNLVPELHAEGAAVAAAANRAPADVGTSLVAAGSQWSVANLYRYVTMPHFTPEPGFDYSKNLNAPDVPPGLSHDELEFLAKSDSPDSWAWHLQQLKNSRNAAQLMGDHPAFSGIALMADPGYLALDAVAPWAAGAVNAGRLARVGLNLAGTAGLLAAEDQVRPVSNQEILTTMLLQGAASAMIPDKLGRATKLDPELPDQELANAAKSLQPPPPVGDQVYAPRVNPDGSPVLHPTTGKPLYGLADRTQVEAGQVAKTAQEADELAGVVREAQDVVPEGKPVQPAEPVPDVSPKLPGSKPAAAVSASPRAIPLADIDTAVARSGDGFLQDMWQHLKDKAQPILDKTPVYVLPAQKYDAKMAELEAQQPVGKQIPLKGSSGVYVNGEGSVYLRLGTDPSTAVHELSHAATVAKLHYGKLNPDSATGRIRAQLEDLRQHAQLEMQVNGHRWSDLEPGAAKDAMDGSLYYTKNDREFVAGLYSGDSGFVRTLASMPDPLGGKNLLTRAVDTVRRLLGFNSNKGTALARAMHLADQLLDTSELAGFKTVQHDAQFVMKKIDMSAKKVGDKIAWNLHKTLANFGSMGRKVADALVDNPGDFSGHSAESTRQSLKRQLDVSAADAFDTLRAEMAERGAGIRQQLQPWTVRQALATQRQIEDEVAQVMLARQQAQRLGTQANLNGFKPNIIKMADQLQVVSDTALREGQRLGIKGFDTIEQQAGYFSRHWDAGKLDTVVKRLTASMTGTAEEVTKAAHTQIINYLARSMQRANGWDRDLAHDIARVIVDRTIRKGQFTDADFRVHAGNDTLAKVRDELAGSGIPKDRQQRVMDVLAGQVDEAGKISVAKHRIDLDYSLGMPMPDGKPVSILDLIDTRMGDLTERYINKVSGYAGLASVGLDTPTAIGKLKKEFIEGIDNMHDRAEASKIFDGTVSYLQGNPIGADMSTAMRKLQAVNQCIALGGSGILQVMDYATPMAKYGLTRTVGYMLSNMPFFRSLFEELNPTEAAHLKNILSTQSVVDLRMKPIVSHLEDNYEADLKSQSLLALTQARQMVPYLNGLKYVHGHQARVTANLIVDTLNRAASGDAKAVQLLEGYGLKGDALRAVSDDIKANGMMVDKWADGTWAAVRDPLNKMMDESVLKNRLGEIPAFAQFSTAGKFLFTFRSFVLGAHNKILASTLGRQGYWGVSLLALYQLPLAFLTTAANDMVQGQKQQTVPKLIAQSISQMGVLGLFGDIAGAVLGTRNTFGSPGTIALDKAFTLMNDLGRGNLGQAGYDVATSMWLLPVIPGFKAAMSQLKTMDPQTSQHQQSK